MSRQRRLLRAGREVPDLQRRIVGACDELGVRRGYCEPSYGFRVCLNLLDVVEVCLPVLYYARLVCREKPVVGMCVLDAANSGLVRLHNGLEVEAHAVPQRELAAGRASEQAPAFWRPLDYVDRVLDLVEGRVYGFGRYRFGSAGDSGCGRCHVHDVACTRPLDLGHGDILVARPPVAHPLHRRRAIVGYRPCVIVLVSGAILEHHARELNSTTLISLRCPGKKSEG